MKIRKGKSTIMPKIEDKNINQKALVSGIWYTASNFIIKALSVLTLPLFTRLLTEEQFGDYNTYISWQNIIIIIASLNIESTLISAKFEFRNLDQYILSVLTLSTVSTCIYIVIFNVFHDTFTGIFGMSQLNMNFMMAYIIFYVSINMYQMKERYSFQYRHTVLISLFVSVSTVLMSLCLVLSMEDKLTGRIIGNVLPTILIGLAIYVYFIKKGKRIEISIWKYALPICLPYIPHLLSLTILNSTDKIMITKFCDSRSTALYSLAYSCGLMITLLMNSINSAFSPWFGNKLNEKDYSSIQKVVPIYILIFCVLAIGVALLAPEVLYILGGSPYMEAKYVMTPVAMGCVLQFFYTLFVNVEQYEKKTKWMALASVSTAILNIGLNYIFIPMYGYIAAAYTTMAGYFWLLIAHMLIVKSIKMDRIFNYKFIFITAFIMTGFMIGITFLYAYNEARYIVIIIYSILLFTIFCKKKSYIMKLFKK